MENITNELAATQLKQVVKQVINAWQAQNKTVTEFFNKYENGFYLKEIAPARNRAIYLLGHLIAINDGMFPMFGLGEKLFPQYETIFITSPDKTIADIPAIEELKQKWEALNQTFTEQFNKMEVADWLRRHTKVSEADFAIDPLRNKLNVLIGRVNHQSYHIGQLNLLTPKS